MINFELKIWNNEKFHIIKPSYIVNAKIKQKKGKNAKKNETDVDSPLGDGERDRKSLLKRDLLLLLSVTILENSNIRILLVLIWDETKILQLSKNFKFSERGDP